MCLLIQFFCLGKIRSLLPYQPVYSKEMADRIEKIEHDKIDKNSRSIRNSFSFQPVDCLCTYKVLNIQFTVFYFLLFSMPNFKCGCIVLIRPIIIWIYNFFMIRVQRIPAWIKPHQPFFWNNQTVWMSTPRLQKYHGHILFYAKSSGFEEDQVSGKYPVLSSDNNWPGIRHRVCVDNVTMLIAQEMPQSRMSSYFPDQNFQYNKQTYKDI